MIEIAVTARLCIVYNQPRPPTCSSIHHHEPLHLDHGRVTVRDDNVRKHRRAVPATIAHRGQLRKKFGCNKERPRALQSLELAHQVRNCDTALLIERGANEESSEEWRVACVAAQRTLAKT